MESFGVEFAAKVAEDFSAADREKAKLLNDTLDSYFPDFSEENKVRVLYFLAKFLDEMNGHLTLLELFGESTVSYIERAVDAISVAGIVKLADTGKAETKASAEESAGS